MKFGILGSGAGGQALAFELADKGFAAIITDLPGFTTHLEAIRKNNGVTRKQGEEVTIRPVRVSTDIKEVLEESDIVFVVTPAFGTKPFAAACRPYIRQEQHFIICPGSGGGALEFKKELGLDLFDEDIIVAETHTLPYAARVLEPGTIRIKLFVKQLILTALPSKKAEVIAEVARKIWGSEKIKVGKSVLETALIDGNPVIHPPVTILNAALIQRTKGDFLFYHEGITDAAADLMQAVDEERLALAKALGFDLLSEPQMSYNEGYIDADKVNYRDGYNKSKGFGITKAPDSLENRYLTEDVGYVMVFWSTLGDLLDVETPTIDAIITITSKMLGRDFRRIGARTAVTLGLTKENIYEI